MEYLKGPAASSPGCVLCCECGVPIPPNPANMCVACLRTQVDISEGIPKQVSINFCKQCERYLQPPGTWIQCALESRELLTLCLKKIKASLSKVRLIEAGFVWTEPHSKRLKVKLTIQKEVLNGAILQQVFVVEYVVQPQMCDACHRVEAKDFWKAVVQVRQKTLHKKTFYYLEQLILKHRAHQNTLRIKEIHDGLDFYYAQKQHAQKMVDFLQCTVPCRSKSSQRLISHDIHSNTYNYKSTFSVEIVPICKDNVVCLSPKLAQSLGNMSQICVCIRVTSAIHLIDPNTLQIAEIDGNTYWRYPFSSLCHPKQLEEFIVMECSLVHNQKAVAGAGMRSNKHMLAEVWVQKTSEMNTDNQYFCRTHLGHLLNPGDLVLGWVRQGPLVGTWGPRLKFGLGCSLKAPGREEEAGTRTGRRPGPGQTGRRLGIGEGGGLVWFPHALWPLGGCAGAGSVEETPACPVSAQSLVRSICPLHCNFSPGHLCRAWAGVGASSLSCLGSP
uniref:60S ribosomal export protein NMD3 n=1 Tax=Sarcophilus harrisii TaxID=9305 RepID=A0A7N4NW00_SARHA